MIMLFITIYLVILCAYVIELKMKKIGTGFLYLFDASYHIPSLINMKIFFEYLEI